MKRVYGWEDVGDAPGDFFGITVEHLFAEVWNREPLTDRERRLLLIGLLTGMGEHDVAELQIDAALNNEELSAVELREIALFLVHYAGWPRGTKLNMTIEKLVGVFDVLKPHLAEVYEKTMLETDQIADAPTIEILETIVRKTRRHIAWGQEVLDRLCDTDARRERRRARAAELRSQLIRCGGVTGEIAPGTA